MVIDIPTTESFVSASGLVDINSLQAIYKSVIDETFLDLGRTITIHLEPKRAANNNTIAQPQANRYNPFFGGVPVPRTNTKTTGVEITPREVQYTAHIKVGPLKDGNDLSGMGDLKENEAMVTLHINALPHIQAALQVTIEGRRYTVDETRPIGFTKRQYLMVKLTEINAQDLALGDNEG